MSINIREMTKSDIADLTDLRTAYEPGYFDKCLEEQTAGKRQVFVALYDGSICGYVHLIARPAYAAFQKQDIPEIQDLYVTPDMRCQGVGGALVEYCEGIAKQSGKAQIGIGVGLYNSYGAAQRLYVQMGYVPDGAGVVYECEPVKGGEIRPVDDHLCLKFIKEL